MFLFPSNAIETEYSIKKSRFITRAAYAENRADAMQLLDLAKQDYPDARHHCWAYLFGDSEANSNASMSDDGEPSGTAGKPILNVIQHKEIGNIMIIVIRYFGGIKLGAGGLVRAYSAAAQQAMDILTLEKAIPMISRTVLLAFSQEQFLRHFAGLYQAELGEVIYTDRVSIELKVPEQHLPELEKEAASHNWQLIQPD
ncbi:MAG: YigZ family protein [Arenicella sp.]